MESDQGARRILRQMLDDSPPVAGRVAQIAHDGPAGEAHLDVVHGMCAVPRFRRGLGLMRMRPFEREVIAHRRLPFDDRDPDPLGVKHPE